MALAAVLATVEPRPVVAHVVHDIREIALARADRDAVKRLAGMLGCLFVERAVAVSELDGNLEQNARHARYAALCQIADEVGAGIIATGHHSDDQLETVLMNLIRGTGVRGMGGVSPTRMMGSVTIVRPMLDVTREEVEALCRSGGFDWQHDHTNDDQGYLRNRVRHSVIPVLKEIEPEVARRASGYAKSSRDTSEVLASVVDREIVSTAKRSGTDWAWARDSLRDQARACLAELVFVYIRDVLGGVGADSISRRAIEEFVRGVKSGDTDRRIYRVGPIVVHVQARTVVFSDARAAASEEAGQERS